jgi:2-dehydropantoate 2-reductase
MDEKFNAPVTPMRIGIFGAGAIGGHLAAKLSSAGHQVSVIARGANLAAIAQRGIMLHTRDRQIKGKIHTASDRAEDLGPQDIVFCTVKTTGLSAFAATVGPMLGPQTMVVFAQNGIPWWYNNGLSPSLPKPPDLSHLDPDGTLATTVGAERVIGATVYTANALIEPGVVRHEIPDSNRLIVGEPGDQPSERIMQLRSILENAGIDSPATDNIRAMIWGKLMLNLSEAPICLLTDHSLDVIVGDPALGHIFIRLIHEGLAIAAASGIKLDNEAILKRLSKFLTVPHHHKASIFLDYQQGRPMEIETMIMTPVAFGRAAGVLMPTLDALTAIIARRVIEKGLYTPAGSG